MSDEMESVFVMPSVHNSNEDDDDREHEEQEQKRIQQEVRIFKKITRIHIQGSLVFLMSIRVYELNWVN